MHALPFWQSDPYIKRPALVGDITADVVVVGGGITGVSAAYHSIKAGFNTVLIERDALASGSAGKNGGMVVEGFACDFSEALTHMGPKVAVEAWRRTADTRDYVANLINDEGIECNLEPGGSAYAGSNVHDREWLSGELGARLEYGFSGRMAEQGELFPGGKFDQSLFVEGDFGINPAKFVRGLAAAAEKMGLLIFEDTPALSYSADTVVTGGGSVRAKHVVLALETAMPDLATSRNLLKREMAIVTEPLSSDAWERMGWEKGRMFWVTGSETEYFTARKVGDRLFLNGGEVSLNPDQDELAKATESVIGSLLERFPGLKRSDIVVSHEWSGLLLYPSRRLPHIRDKNGYWELYGSGGNGLTNGIMLGMLFADGIQGKDIPHYYGD